MSATKVQDSLPVNSQDAKFLAAVVDNIRCAFSSHQANPKALRARVAEILSEDGIGQASANVVNAC